MPFTVNGVGTNLCGARGHVRWGAEDDRDAVECLVVFFMPILPYRTVHSFNWRGSQYQAIPIRWSMGLILRAMLRRWLLVPAIVGLIFAVMAIADYANARANGESPYMLAGSLGALTIGAAGWWGLRASDRRNRAIRRVLGPHQFGSSDPATWTNALLASVKDPREMHGTATYADGVAKCLSAGAYSDAMWAARLSTALEDQVNGELLTDTVLNDPNVQDALVRVEKQPQVWAEVMRPMPAHSAPRPSV